MASLGTELEDFVALMRYIQFEYVHAFSSQGCRLVEASARTTSQR